MNSRFRRYVLTAIIVLCRLPAAGEAENEQKGMEVQELIRSAEGYFILGDDEEGFKTLDAAMEKYGDEPEAGEFLYVKATELCRDHRTDTEKAKGKKLLKEYVDQFPKGNHFPKVLSQIHGDLASGEQEKQYRTIIELHPQSNERPWAMLQLASLIAQSNPEEAHTLRHRHEVHSRGRNGNHVPQTLVPGEADVLDSERLLDKPYSLPNLPPTMGAECNEEKEVAAFG